MNSDNDSAFHLKICKICGDKALGFNFNGLSCESCKAFFRRNAVKAKQFVCRKEGDCQIDKTNRKRCKRCRLNKCYEIGMKRELICSYKSPNPNERFLTLYKDLNTLKKEYLSYEADDVPINPLNESEIASLCEVHNAMNRAFSVEEEAKIEGLAPNMGSVLNFPALYIKKTIKYCKAFSAFQALKQSDQLILLKSFYTELSVARHAFLYCLEKDGFPMINSESENTAVYVKCDVFNEWKKKDLAKIIRGYIYAFQIEMEQDVMIRNLILAQLLFRIKADVSCPEFVRYHYIKYCHLLQRYLEHKYKNVNKAKQKYLALMYISNDINCVTDNVDMAYKEWDRTELSHVLAEIYNLL